MDTSKNQQAAKIIASNISGIPANTKMDCGTIGALKGMTKREGEALSMARYFVAQMGGKFSGSLPENWTDEERESVKIAEEIAAAAISISGK